MKILALDTSSHRGTSALVEDDAVVVEVCWSLPPRSTTERVVPTLEWMLEQAGWSYSDLDALAVTAGPGSFTGLRVGLSVAQGIRAAWDLPAVGVSSLEALAQPYAHLEGLVVPWLDARKKEVYAAAFEATGDGLQRRIDDTVCSPAHFLQQVADTGSQPVWFLGPGAEVYRSEIQAHSQGRVLSKVLPRGRDVALLGARQLAAGITSTSLEPRYLRQPEAIVDRKKKQKKNAR